MTEIKIRKRNGTVTKFQVDKITQAIKNAGKETGEIDGGEAEKLTQKVVDRLGELEELMVENVQDLVESVLLNSEYKATAKAYIIYRELRKRDRSPDIDRKSTRLNSSHVAISYAV